MRRSSATRPTTRVSLLVVVLLACLLTGASSAAASTAAAKPLKVGPVALRLATATVPYAQQLNAVGGAAPYTFSVESGAPPEGITLSPTGEVSGTLSAAGTSTFTVLATDSSSPAQTASVTYTMKVQLAIGPGTLPATKAFSTWGFRRRLTAAGGSGEYSFSLDSGALPLGVFLYPGPELPELSGTPDVAGTFKFAIKATDSAGHTGLRDYTMNVALGLYPATPHVGDGFVGQAYSNSLSAEGGSGSYGYEVTEGLLPEGLSLKEEGGGATIVGTPLSPGISTFLVTAQDHETGLKMTQKYRIGIWSASFPAGPVETEEQQPEGEPVRGFLYLEAKHEVNGRLGGRVYEGSWTYDLTTHSLRMAVRTERAGPVTLYTATCEPVGETCSGKGPVGPFTLKRWQF
jgi:hypothetical protein